MKYKNIGLDRASLYCVIDIDNNNSDNSTINNIKKQINELFKNFGYYVRVEKDFGEELKTSFLVSCIDAKPDKKGLDILRKIYERLSESEIGINIMVGIWLLDISVYDKWFEREDGSTYDFDEATMEEFLENLEY